MVRNPFRAMAGRLSMAFAALLAATVPAAGHEEIGHRAEVVSIATSSQLTEAVAGARPGQVLLLAPGAYLVGGQAIAVNRPGTAAAPIALKAGRLGDAVIRLSTVEGFLVSAPYWIFENLVIEGVCTRDDDCEHAFHVVGGGRRVTIRNNRLIDFNAQIKVNGVGGIFPDWGLVEGNAIYSRRPRRTANPVTAIDIVGASGWVVRRNLIADFVKAGGDHTSYAAFMKGGGEDGVFDGNLVACRLAVPQQSWGEQRVGLSFGGGGTGDRYCRGGRCLFEHRSGMMRNNIIHDCSDVGIYLNKAPAARIFHNTLWSTAGIDARFVPTTAVIRNTIFGGRLRERDGGQIIAADNRPGSAAWFVAAAMGDFRLRPGSPAAGAAPFLDEVPTDICGHRRRGRQVSLGAIEAGDVDCDPAGWFPVPGKRAAR